jgi:hypothetical protein
MNLPAVGGIAKPRSGRNGAGQSKPGSAAWLVGFGRFAPGWHTRTGVPPAGESPSRTVLRFMLGTQAHLHTTLNKSRDERTAWEAGRARPPQWIPEPPNGCPTGDFCVGSKPTLGSVCLAAPRGRAFHRLAWFYPTPWVWLKFSISKKSSIGFHLIGETTASALG